MTPPSHRWHPTRRLFLQDLGRLSLGALVLGACSSTTETPAHEVSNSASATSSPNAAADAATATETTSPETAATAEPLAAVEPAWARVDLQIVSAFVLVRDGEAIVVDTGVEGSAPAILETLETMGAGWDDLSTVFVTHGHPDHDGGLRAVTFAAPDAAVYAGEADISSMDSDSQITAVADGEMVAGMQVVATPGHTPGHISVIDPVAGWLLAGDALNGADGAILGPNPQFSQNMDQGLESARKLADYDFDSAGFGHGGPILGGAKAELDKLVATF